MSSIDTSVIIENLTELLQNTVNMTSVFYDIFLNPTPMDVELQQYNSDGELVTVTIPNRAKDRSIALSGTGSPEGVITANVGTSYVDVANEVVYFKAVGNGNTGWIVVLTQNGVEQYVRAYLTNNNFMTEDDVNRYLIDNNYVTTTSLASTLNAYKPTIPMSTMTASGTINLDDNSGYAITATGNITFQLPTVTDLTILHKIFVQLYMSTVRTINLGTSNYFDKIAPDLSVSGMYNIMYEYDNARGVWVVGTMIKGVAE